MPAGRVWNPDTSEWDYLGAPEDQGIPESLGANAGDMVVFDGTDWVKFDAPPGDGYNLSSDMSQPGSMKWQPPSVAGINTGTNYNHANSAWDPIYVNTARVNVGGMHSGAATDRLTCVNAGMYVFSGSVACLASATGVRAIRIHQYNSSAALIAQLAYHEESADGSTFARSISSTPCSMAVGDYVRMEFIQTSGGYLTIYAGLSGLGGFRIA